MSSTPASLPAGAAPRLVVLVSQDARRDWLCTLVGDISPACRIEVASSLIDASLRLSRNQAETLLLDFAFERGPSLALIRHLARLPRLTSILAFDESAHRLPIAPYDVRPWQDAPAVLRQALERHQTDAPPPTTN